VIRYALQCERGHAFESWFQSSGAYEKQTRRALVTCPVCGSAKVEKAIMTPRLSRSKAAEPRAATPAVPPPPAPSRTPVAIMSPQERELRGKLKELREHLTKNADYVGQRFPDEARKIHYGDVKHRSIYGEASPDEARELHEEGIEFHPLPILPDEFN